MNEDFALIPEELAIKQPKRELLKIINEKKFKDKVLYETKSAFHDIKVVENEIGKFLHYNNTYQAGFIDTYFYKGNLPYINYFLIPYLMNVKVEKILLIGFGTGKIVSQYEYLFENLERIDVVDIEENILKIATEYFEFLPSSKFNFILQDGLIYLRQNKTKYDLIVVDVANNDGIDLRFLSDEYFENIKKSLKKSGIFVSNMCASPEFENAKNKFIKKYFPLYKKNFKQIHVFKGNMSDRVYYKSFFDIDERVIDVTNVILISSEKHEKIRKKQENVDKILTLGINIEDYLKDEV